MSAEQKALGTGKAILTDVTKCIGCERCVEACVRQHKLPQELPSRFRANDGLSARRFTAIARIPGKTEGTWRNVRRQCMHCQEPACASACLVGAFTKTADGGVVYDDKKCIGCRYCMLACPFGIPRYEYEATLPYVRKCKMSDECRVEGGLPACVAACPTKATVFGPRDKLIEEARRRIEAEPDHYENRIYGEYELGGTSVLYLSDVPLGPTIKMPSPADLEKLRMPELATQSVPSLMHGWVMVTPFQFVTVGLGLAGTWVIRRRMKRAEELGAAKQDKNEGGE